jgi:hypothetical protein
MAKTTDGPYAETKEHLGGFYIIEAPDQGRSDVSPAGCPSGGSPTRPRE